MRKRFLAGLLAAGLALQSFALPVYAAGEEQAQVRVSETDSREMADAASGEGEGTGTEETVPASEEGEKQEETASNAEECEDTEETAPVSEEIGTENAGTAPEDKTEDVRQDETGDEYGTEETEEEEPEESAGNRLQEPAEENGELKIGYVNSGEGVYQEGSFTVIGGTAGEDEYGISLDGESDFSGAEAYLYERFVNREETIDLSEYEIPVSRVGALVSGILNEHPELYYVDGGFSYSYYESNSQKTVWNVYMTYGDGFDDAAFDQAVKDALSVVKEGMTELEKAIALHEYIVLNCEYDYENLNNNTLPATVYSAYGVMVNRTAVCQGYALAYKMLLNMAGIECHMVSSSAMNHAWNLVKLDGEYYQADTTWDDPVWDKFGLVRHSYMFVSDEAFGTESDGRGRHYDWVITKGGEVVDLKAQDTRYDNAFWTGCSSPLILSDHSYYYIDSGTRNIYVRNSLEGEPSALVADIGTWPYMDGGFWKGAFSGLFLIEGRLYFNTPYKIRSVSVEGGDVRDETDDLNTSGQYIYSSAFCQGKVQYVLHENPNYEGKETILIANLKNVTIDNIALIPVTVSIALGDSITLKPVLTPSYASAEKINWVTSDATIATVSDGVVTAVGEEGSCTITAEADGKIAVCTVNILSRLKEPTFSPEAGLADKGESVTISAEAGMDIYYTTDGSKPDVSGRGSTKKYTEPIVINEDMTIRAIAVDPNGQYGNSSIVQASYQACTNNLILEREAVTLSKGETAAIGIKELPTTKTASDVSWKSSDETVVTVAADGGLTAVSEGNAIVTATVSDRKGREITARCSVTVDDSEYQVTFTGWNQEVIKTETVRAGKPATPPAQVEASEGYEFTGWKGDYGSISRNTTIEALFAPIVYTITYRLEGGANGAGNPAEYTIESGDITLKPAGGKEGFLFIGWYSDENYQNKVETIKKGSYGDITLYAKWKDERGLWLKAEGSDTENAIPDMPYTGKAVKPAVKVFYGGTPLTAGTDYTISYKNNTAANLLQTDAEKGKAPTVVVKGKGNFAGVLTQSFKITPQTIAVADKENVRSDEVQADDLAAAYNKGKAVKPVPVLTWNGKKLSNKKDFTVEYPDTGADAYKKPGSYTIRVTGKGNFTGTREISLTVTDPNKEVLLSKVKVAKIPDQPYTGSEVKFSQAMPKLTYGQETLVWHTDYELSLAAGDDGISAGTHVLVITGKGNYKGVRRVNFKITGTPIKNATVEGMRSLAYNGDEQEFGEGTANHLTVKDKDGKTLREGQDYTLSFSNNKNAGTAKMVITGSGKYTGKVTKTFKITPYSVEEGSVGIKAVFENGSTEQPYEKGGAKPKVKVVFGDTELEEGTDYTLSYANNTSVNPREGKDPTVTIRGKKNFTGKRSLTFTVKAKKLEGEGVSITAPDLVENTKAGKYMSVPALTDSNGKKLKAGTDYEKTYVYKDENGKVLGKDDRPLKGSVLTVVVTGKGNYTGQTEVSFRILEKGKDISKAKASVNKKVYYTGEKIELDRKDLTVKLGTTTLTADDFEIIGYSNNLKIGTAKVTIRGKGGYGGTKQVSFKILSQKMEWWKK